MPDTNTVYENLSGVLVGYYALAVRGFLGLDKQIELESAWLTTVAGVTTLSLAMYNRGAAPNATRNIKIAVYE